jgi:hypothetical protein
VTFFNYFPSKNDLLVYFIQMWSIEVSYFIDRELENKSGLEEIEYIFRFTADVIVDNPNLMTEIIAFVTKNFNTIRFKEVSEVENILMFPGFESIETYKPVQINELFGKRIYKAIKLGELPETTDIEFVSFSMIAIFFGVPIGWTRYAPERISTMYLDNLKILWDGLRSKTKDKKGRKG